MTTENKPEVTETPVTKPAEIDISLIRAMAEIIDHAAEQGAFKGWGTIQQVLTVRKNVEVLLQSLTPPAPPEAVAPEVVETTKKTSKKKAK